MLNHAFILLFTLAVLAILSLSERGTARSLQTDVIVINNGCYTIASQHICPPEIKGYVTAPIKAGPGDVFFINPGQQQQQQQIQQIEPGKEGPGQHQQQPPNQTGGGLIVGPDRP